MARAPAALSFESGDCMRFLILVETPPLNAANRSGDHSVWWSADNLEPEICSIYLTS
jgi:hypothetical protein